MWRADRLMAMLAGNPSSRQGAGRGMLENGAIMLASQLLSALPATAAMGRFGFGPPVQVLASLAAAALVSAPLAVAVFATIGRRSVGRAACVLLGAGCSIASFPAAYALKALWDMAVGGGDPSGSWTGAILAMLALPVGALSIATLLIPYAGGGLAGYLIWRRLRHRRPALLTTASIDQEAEGL